ncbi:MAG: diguanylate cyclase [Planctomycetaceae bacterium]
MFRFSSTLRAAIGITSLSCSLVLIGSVLGMFPDRRQNIIEDRHGLAESVAVFYTELATRMDVESVQLTMEGVLDRNPTLEAIWVRESDGTIAVLAGNSEVTTDEVESSRDAVDNENSISVPIYREDGNTYGDVVLNFASIDPEGTMGWLARPEYKLALYFSSVGLVLYYLYFSFVLRQLNPQRAIPKRVRQALDTLAEGLLVVDSKERIVLANSAFGAATGLDKDELIGRQASTIPFKSGEDEDQVVHPWRSTLQEGDVVRGQLMYLPSPNCTSAFSVSSTEVLDDEGVRRGAIVSFEDVTQIEEQRAKLKKMVFALQDSAEEIRRQNANLQTLATQDPLTECLNRRSFFEKFDEQWTAFRSSGVPLSALMVDIDFFKSINDTHGHAVGDEVLRDVGKCLKSMVRKSDVVSRYGGEEFSVLLPNTSVDQAADIAEGLRTALEKLSFSVESLQISASLGVSSSSLGSDSPQGLLEQADKCLYVAKRNGRNQVVRWDEVPDDIDVDESTIRRTPESVSVDAAEPTLPFPAVTALISALAFRDQETANHCRRVADLCVAVAESKLSMKECYVLEIAGLLHDIGKIGVPDAILLKPGKLTKSEWGVMQSHRRIGIQIVETSFSHPKLTETIRCYRDLYATEGERIPLAARILAIADAYDSMTTDRSYRKAVSSDEAFQELRRCAGIQFDPGLVEDFIERVKTFEGQHRRGVTNTIAHDAAATIGTQIGQLVEAIEDFRKEDISAIASRLQQATSKYNVNHISEKASAVAELTAESDDDYEVLAAAHELLEICRSTQNSLLVRETG